MNNTTVAIKMQEAYARVGLSPTGAPIDETSRHAQMVESFKDMGYSQQGAEFAARGRDREPATGDLAASLREAYERGDERAAAKALHQSLKESFVAMGYSEAQAERAATPRGEYRYR